MKSNIKLYLAKLFSKIVDEPVTINSLVNLHNDYGQDKPILQNCSNPYYDYPASHCELGESAVFITGRFRSGSTLLWNVFRESPEFTAYYEPFNERKWFDANFRGDFVDNTHRGVENYWLEYDGLQDLSLWYERNWTKNELYMSEALYNPKMKRFIDTLIKRAPQRPVLQFNRIDFRLPWLKKQYPKAKFVHLYRNPRDQWCSFLSDKTLMNKNDVENTYVDGFYLNGWCEDLSKHFPFLSPESTPHPYMRFYYLWKLSYIFGKKYADLSISYENFVENTADTVNVLKDFIGADKSLVDVAESLISVTSVGSWIKYAETDWFMDKEKECEATLVEFFKTGLDIPSLK